MRLTTKLNEADRIHKMYAKRLEKLGITKFVDFLYHIPNRYDDLSHITTITDAVNNETVTIQGKLTEIKNVFTKRSSKLQQGKIIDDTGTLDLLWFNQPFLTRSLHIGDTLSLSGRVERKGAKTILVSPTYEVIQNGEQPIHTGRLVPIYPETYGVTSKWLRRQIYTLLHESQEDIEDFLPQNIKNTMNLMDLLPALQQVHFPSSLEKAEKARERLGFDEVFFAQITGMKRRKEWKEDQKGIIFHSFSKEMQHFFSSLPFTLTHAQERSINEIQADLTCGKPMNRLLEGDVGSGKTVVAATAMYLAYLNGYQSVLMAPTEILAQQHFTNITKLVEKRGVQVGLATGSKKTIKKNVCDMLIGTHAVLSESITFDRLGLIIIDEQQRFGVSQRSLLRSKGENPHLLTMTATPIPRTIALTLYGDLDLSLLDEMPKGRRIVKTWLVPQEKRSGAYQWIREHIRDKEQIFIICPFVEESENMITVKAAKKEFERLQEEIFPDLRITLLHGKMKPKEKEVVLQEFREKKYDILVSTPVVEVGIDIPNATVIVVEGAERFGLAGLHQLRGRVGRGDKQSYCLLFTEAKNQTTITRLKALEKLHNGVALSELDLKMRGAGELYGTLQHGRKWFKIASPDNISLMENANQAAKIIFVNLKKYPKIEEKLDNSVTEFISPD